MMEAGATQLPLFRLQDINTTQMHRLLATLLIPFCAIGLICPAQADEQYQTPEAFVAEAFSGKSPEVSVLWITGGLREQARAILEHEPDSLRVRYWRRDARTVWVLEEIGKERPITTGWVVENNVIQKGKVLVYRESRGFEVHLPFFTKQFSQTGLDDKLELDHHIDGITGATLSVNSMRRMARLALLYHRHVIGDVTPNH